jgi:hypothetical protein
MPPRSAIGMLVSRANAAAAIAATSRIVKYVDASCAKRGAIRTPARPATRLDSIQENELTRSALMPTSAVMRGLSTTARIFSPMLENRNRSVSTTTTINVAISVAASFPSIA